MSVFVFDNETIGMIRYIWQTNVLRIYSWASRPKPAPCALSWKEYYYRLD